MQELRDGCYHFENGDGGGFFVTVKDRQIQRWDEGGEVVGTIRVLDRTYRWSRHLEDAPQLIPNSGNWVLKPNPNAAIEVEIRGLFEKILVTKAELLAIANQELQMQPFYVEGLRFDDASVVSGWLQLGSNFNELLPLDKWDGVQGFGDAMARRFRLVE